MNQTLKLLEAILEIPEPPVNLEGLAAYRQLIFNQAQAKEKLFAAKPVMNAASRAMVDAAAKQYREAKRRLGDDAAFEGLAPETFPLFAELEARRMDSALRSALRVRQAHDMGCAHLRDASFEDLLPWLAWRQGCFPYEAVVEARRRIDELALSFEGELTGLAFRPQDAEGCAAPVLLGLLAEAGFSDAFALLLERLRGQPQGQREEHPDGWDEWFHQEAARLMAAMGRNDPERVLKLSGNLDEHEFIRGIALDALKSLVLHAQLPRKKVIHSLTQMEKALPRKSSWDWTGWVDTAMCLAPEELGAKILKAVNEKLMDEENWVHLHEVEAAIEKGWKGQRKSLAEDNRLKAFDLVESLETEAFFWQADTVKSVLPEGYVLDPDSGARLKKPSVGRNDPCFCGSGKKYKRCHGR